jgi:MYXO-CTERM domain-containing protein
MRAALVALLAGYSVEALTAAPLATTVAASGITTSSAVLNGVGTPKGEATTGRFRYATTDPGTCNDTFGTRVPTSGGTDLGTGSSAVPYSITVSGLTPGTTYYFCAIVSNSSGTAFGAVLQFTIPTFPAVVTGSAASITANSATLQATANPLAASSIGWFRYSSSSVTTCDDSFGTRVPSSSGTSLGAGITPVAYQQSIGGLLPNTTYYYCAIANNAYGNGFGGVQSFTTPATAPIINTGYASSLTRTTGVLNGSGNPGGAATTGWFRYATASPGTCNDTFGTRTPATGGASLGSGSSNTNFSQAITGLSAATTYYYCAIGSNSAGTNWGSVQSFTTPASPTARTSTATSISDTSAYLNGYGNPNRTAAVGWFRYAISNPGACDDKFGSRAPTSGSSALGSDVNEVAFNQPISGLSPATTYWYCAIVSSSEGTAFGAVMTFSTSSPPTATTNAASGITSSGATLNGSGNPQGTSAQGWFRYSNADPGVCSDSFGTRVPSSSYVNLGAGYGMTPYSQSIGSLLPSTKYYYCAIVYNGYGYAYGSVQSFTTPAMPPTVNTGYASSLTRTTGVLNGSSNPGGDATTAWFRYSTTSPGTCNDSFGTRAPAMGASAVGSGTSTASFSQPVTGLTANTTYYFCAIAQNSLGQVFGSVQTFITPASPTVATRPASNITDSSAYINGIGNPNRANTVGWFRYSTTNPGTCDDKFGSRAPTSGSSALGADIYDTPFNQTLSGLSPNTTYYFCAIVSSSEGTAFGSLLSFTTSSAATATTVAASSIGSGVATLNGAGNPNSSSAQGWFRYSNVDPGSCNDSFGTRVPSSSYVNLGAGAASVPYSQGIAGLNPGTKYYFCAIVTNGYGTGYGSVLNFTTPATGPIVTTGGATMLTRTTGTLTGYANPGGDATTVWFRYGTLSPGTCNDSFGTRAPAMGGTALGAGTSNVPFSQAITGLAANTTYYYCAIGQNSIGVVLGGVNTFTTPAAPTAVTTAATNVTTNSAYLNGTGNPNRASAQGWFRYATSDPGACDDKFGSRAPVTGAQGLGSDVYDQPYQQSIGGLSSSTTYYYCAIVQSSEGTAFGNVLTFTTAGIPTTTTVAATSITAGGATLNGTGNPNGGTAQGWLRYSTSDPGTCNDSFGTRVPTSSYVNLGAGMVSVPFSQSIGGLLPGTKYYFCAIASNSYGMGYGAVLNFTTPAQAPTVSTSYASSLTRTTGVLNGYGNPGGDATTGWFRFSTSSPGTCNDSFGTRAPAMGGSAMGSGTSNTNFSQPITGLTANTTYYFCALAENSMGKVVGSVQTFITPAAPTVVTTAANNISDSSAYLNGTGNPSRSSTIGWFRYATTKPAACDDKFGSRAPVSGGSSLGADIYDQPFQQGISGLSPNTTYYYCALVASTEGTATGSVLSFTTASAPTADTSAATGITSTGATINGAGVPNGAATQGWFRYSATDPGTCNDSFGSRVPTSSYVNLGGGTVSVPYSQSIGGLLPGTKYYFCAIVQNSYGMGYGSVRNFTTPAQGPTVNTGYASNLTMTTGLLNGSGNPGGDATTAWFRFSTSSPGTCNDTFGTRAPAMGGVTLGAGNSTVSFSQAITGLTANTTYYYCALAQNSVGSSWGVVQTFTTPTVPTALTTPASNITTSSAYLNGSGNPNRANTLGWFRYATTNPGACDDKFGSRAPTASGSSLGADIYDQPYQQSISGLSPATTYYFCAIVQSSEGTAFGNVLTFTTAAPATATTEAATSVASTTATLNGTGNPNGATAQGWFRYSTTSPGTCNDSFGTRSPTSSGTSLGSGTAKVPFGQAITGLSPGVTYFYCAIVSNSYGTGLGSLLSFTTPASPPTVSTDGATGIAITLNGSANPNGAATTGWFRMATTSPGTCNDTFGTRVPATSGTTLGGGANWVSYQYPAPSLTPGTTYYYCAIASNAVGTSFGVVRSFTAPMPPAVSTLAATPVTATTATLNGSGNPNGNSTIAWFRYSTSSPGACNDVFGTRTPASGGTSLGSGTTATPFAEGVSGLAPATTYYFCAIASSAYGTTLGNVLSFTTPPSSSIKPTEPSGGGGGTDSPVVTKPASELGSESAILNGAANPGGFPSRGWFRYDTKEPTTCDDSFGKRAPEGNDSDVSSDSSKLGTDLGAGAKPVAYAQKLTGLSPNTTYYFCAIAGASERIRFGKVLTLTTGAAPPTVTTEKASDLGADSAVLNASATANGDGVTAWFRYGSSKPERCDDTFGVRAEAFYTPSLAKAGAPVPYSVVVSGLQPGTTYYYCAAAQNAQGLAYGTVLSFVLPGATSTGGEAGDKTTTPTTPTTPTTTDPTGTDPTSTPDTASRTPAAPATAATIATSDGTAAATASADPAATENPAEMRGCSYTARPTPGQSGLPALALLPLAGLLLLRRRRQAQKAA